ncbi:hypothetical protein J5N97_007986 [Dioscorea zingiberensis]|uniref:Uncharacterized protein n=1 Tax=Dioscorea zingiberensis TaxID=325984 RepID=A0A9D5DDE5_9LILI|nr:hypothetical protein J5N97_007986 [Dioscorea zingiberensis]
MRSKVLGIVIQVVVMIIIVSVVLLFLVIGVQILIHACIVVGRTFRRGLSTTERGGSEGGGMSPEDLEQLPSYDFQAVEKSSSSNPIECAICLESFAMGEKCRMLPVLNCEVSTGFSALNP